MKKAYQIDERRAIEKFRSHLLNDHGAIQMILPLAEIAQKLRNGVGQFLLQARLQLLTLIMEDEVESMTGQRYDRRAGKEFQRWGHEDGSVVINGQKVPVHRPRARGRKGDVKIGSYELFRRDEEQQKRIWDAITRGLTTRGYGPTVRESEEAFAIEKSAVSEKFIATSARKVNELLKRDLSKLRVCALLLDGVEVKQQHLVTALGIDETGRKTTSEPHFAAPCYCGNGSPILRCQLHKRRNIVGHFADEEQTGWDRRLANAYDLRSYKEAKAAWLRIQDELNHINPSAARSLKEGLEETLTPHRLKVPLQLWKTLRSTNGACQVFCVNAISVGFR